MASEYDEDYYFSYPSHPQGVSRSRGSDPATQNGRMGAAAFSWRKSITVAKRVAPRLHKKVRLGHTNMVDVLN
jgi:hypothetical protein